MKKILTLGLMFIFSMVLIGCDESLSTSLTDLTTEETTTVPSTETPTTVAPTTEAPTTVAPTTEAPTTVEGTTEEVTTDEGTTEEVTTEEPTTVENTTGETTTEQTTSVTTQEITLTYADWGSPTINQALADAFMELYPNITVILRSDITGTGGAFTQSLLNAQAAGVLPDVFVIDNVPTGFSNGMLYDVTDFWNNDPDTHYVYPNIKDTAVYNGSRFALPSFQFVKGIFMNLTLFDQYNITIPEKDWTYEEFVDIAIEFRQAGIADYVYGIEPVHYTGDLDFEIIWPTQDFANIGYNTWDGTQFNFSSQAWIDAYQAKLDLWAQDVVIDYGNLSEEELSVYGEGSAFIQGYVAMSIQGSWELWYVDHMYDNYGYEVGFWPYPGGAAGQFPPTVLDYTVVSSQTSYPYEAYLLAKFMSFGREGWMTRLDAMEDQGVTYLDRFPVADYPEVWDRIMYNEFGAPSDLLFYVEGVQESIDLFEYSKPDVDKWLPGYSSFWEWVGNDDNDYWTKINDGTITPDVFAAQWEEKINEFVSTALDEYK